MNCKPIAMEQTPQEKAKELFDHYYIIIQDVGGELGQEILVSILAKQCALYLAREKLKEEWELQNFDEYYYWQEVEYYLESLN